jgi:hypothetical protein
VITTNQMTEAPHGAAYIWHCEDRKYPVALAWRLGRRDLQIRSPAHLGLTWSPGSHVVIDHNVAITPTRAVDIARLMQRGVRVHHTAGNAEIAYAAFEAARAAWAAPKPEPSLQASLQAVVDAIKAKMPKRVPPAPTPAPAPRTREVVGYELFVERARFDGTYIFSDNREVFLRGERHFKRICALQDELDALP